MSIILNDISVKYENSPEYILRDVNIEINEGEFVCIVGQSGCGKSTLLKLVAGLQKPCHGNIVCNGKIVKTPGSDRVVMFQEHGLYPWLNVFDNVEFGMKMNNVPKEEREEKAMYYLSMVGLDDYKEYYIHQLSGGMRQRVALARALAMESDILLMDEPFSALDKQTSNRLREELQNICLRTGKTVLFVTHSVEEAVYLADRVIVLSSSTGEIDSEIEIELPRPRTVYSSEFVDLRHKILDLVKGEIA
ncbi:MAG: ABC transporter ATP-binding protein [Lachnospiraceae bacterium]|nr:ABC transporter ATP-binding protein [Lachnospiraceae bacterium]